MNYYTYHYLKHVVVIDIHRLYMYIYPPEISQFHIAMEHGQCINNIYCVYIYIDNSDFP